MVARLAASINPDLFHVHEPELLGAVIAVAKGRPVIWDVHESYLDVLLERHWIPQILRPFLHFGWDHRERQLLRQCAGVVVVTEQIAQRYKALHKKVQIVANHPDLEAFRGLPLPCRDGKTCVYAGIISPSRGLSIVPRALAILKNRNLAIPFKIAGIVSPEGYLQDLVREAIDLGVGDMIQYQGILTKENTILLQHESSISLVPNPPTGNNVASFPTKLLECMALGLPIVYSNLPNYEAVAGAAKAGISFDVSKPEQMADAIEFLVKNPDIAKQMGESGQRAVRERLNWSVESTKLLAMYQEILNQPPLAAVDEK